MQHIVEGVHSFSAITQGDGGTLLALHAHLRIRWFTRFGEILDHDFMAGRLQLQGTFLLFLPIHVELIMFQTLYFNVCLRINAVFQQESS